MSKDTDRLARAAARAITLTMAAYAAAFAVGLLAGFMDRGK